MRSRQGWFGEGVGFCHVTRMPDRFSRLPSAAPLPASPGGLQKTACYFSFRALTSLGFSPTDSAGVRAQWEGGKGRAEAAGPHCRCSHSCVQNEPLQCLGKLAGQYGWGWIQKVVVFLSILQNSEALVKLEMLRVSFHRS